MGCREEILACIEAIERSTGKRRFTPDEVVNRMRESGSRYAESTIRTHIISRLCMNAPANHAKRYKDLERIGDGLYQRRL